jgi:hypothetical protein
MRPPLEYPLSNWKLYPTLKIRERITCRVNEHGVHVTRSAVEYHAVRPYQLTAFTSAGTQFLDSCTHGPQADNRQYQYHTRVVVLKPYNSPSERAKYNAYLASFTGTH